MFYMSTSMENLDISSFDTSKVYKMKSMFFGCDNLKNLDISNFDTSNIPDFNEEMLYQ